MNLRLESLKKVYVAPDGTRVPVVDIASLELPAGSQVALVGSSGSGKTTLLHMIAGILTPDSGHIFFNFQSNSAEHTSAGFWSRNWPTIATLGTPLLFRWLLGKEQEMSKPALGAPTLTNGTVDLPLLTEADRDVFRGANIGYIFQTHHLLAGFTAIENVLLGMSFTGRSHDVKWGTYLLQQVGLANRLDYKPEKLSVGQQQRVAVARALANRPKLVLADEPTGSLDAVNAQQVLGLIRKLCAEVGATLLLVSHDKEITSRFETVMELSQLNRSHRN